jgi:hypothetical protein
MDIKQEINQHLLWIDKIASLIGSEEITQEAIDEITQHDKCELGKWLTSESSEAYRGSNEFQELIDSHNEFHALAGELITAFQEGDEARALESEAEFIAMSQKVIGHLNALNQAKGDS